MFIPSCPDDNKTHLTYYLGGLGIVGNYIPPCLLVICSNVSGLISGFNVVSQYVPLSQYVYSMCVRVGAVQAAVESIRQPWRPPLQVE